MRRLPTRDAHSPAKERSARILLVSLGLSLLAASGGAVAYVLRPKPPLSPVPFRETLSTTPGRVVDMAWFTCGTGRRRRQCARPTVEYDVQGRTYRFVSRVRYSPGPPVPTGGTTSVLYVPSAPQTAWPEFEYPDPAPAERRERIASWIWAGIWGFLALVGLLLALMGWRMPYLEEPA
jgi:hypothetical protein